MNRKSYVHQISEIGPRERVRLRASVSAVASERRCVGVDRRCRESEGKAKIEGYMRVSDEEAHHCRADNHLCHVHKWFSTTEHPLGLTNTTFLCYTKYFFQKDGHLWRRDPQGCHKVVIDCDKQPAILAARHHRDFATCAHIIDCFWWPHLSADIAWFIRTCHICPLHQTHNVLIPLVVAIPAPLFAKMYMDTMHLPKSGGFKYFVQGCCSLAHFSKYHSLHAETTKTIGDWIFKDILCWWSTLCEIITDNGPAFIKALAYLEKRYHIQHIHISGYTSWANGITKHVHFNVWQALFKACDGDQSRWHSIITSIMWADWVTVHWWMGCSLYFATTSTHPLLPLNIAEWTYLLPPPNTPLSSTDLIVQRAVTLQKHQSHLAALTSNMYATWIKAVICFEQERAATIIKYNFKLGNLVLIIKKYLNHKLHVRYLGPLIIILQNKGGAYIISELDGSVFDHPIAAFWVIPYFAHQHIDIPPLDKLMDISSHPLLTPTTIVTTSPTKKILPQTHQVATKTEDSLVFSWKGRHIPFSFHFYFGHFSWMFIFIFRDWYSEFHFHLVCLFTCSWFTFQVSLPFQVHTFMPSVNFPLFAERLPWHDIFALCDTFAKCHKAEVLWLWWITLSLSSFILIFFMFWLNFALVSSPSLSCT